MIKFLRQLLLSAAVAAAALYIWINYVPASHQYLQKYGVAEWLGLELSAPEAQEQPAQRRGGGGASRVLAEAVAEQVLADRIRAIGDARALRSVTLRVQQSGIVSEINATAGDLLEAGQVAVRLDAEAEQITLERATFVVRDAEDELERLRRLQGNVTEVRLRDAELALNTAQLELREAEFDLSQREIRAPITGRVGLVDIEVGARVQAQDALMTLTDRSKLIVDFRLPERIVPYLALGETVELRPLALRGTSLEGEISAIDTIVDLASRSIRVQALVENTEDLLRPGMAFEVEMEFPGERLLSIPPLALQWSSEGAFVWFVQEGKTVPVSVQIRQRNAESVLVDSANTDLKPGALVVIEGVQSLRPGAEVEVLEPQGDQAAAIGDRVKL